MELISVIHFSRLKNLYRLGCAVAFCALSISASAQQNIHLWGVMPTLDVGTALGEHWYIENYAFACVLPFEQSRPSFGNAEVMESYGPGAAPSEPRSVRTLVFAYTELDVTRKLNDAWSLTGSYTHEWVPMNSSVSWAGERYTRDEHRVWLQSKYTRASEGMSWWWRMRWDQRYIENDPAGLEKHPWSRRPRLRQQLGLSLPMGEGALTASTEAFVEAWAGANAFSSQDRFREAWSSLQYGQSLNDNLRWEVGPLLVSWKQLGDAGSLGWSHYWYLQTTAFVTFN